MKSMQGSLIETIKEVPWNLEVFFENFINIFTQKSLLLQGTKLQIIENGPREGLSSMFQLYPSGASTTKFKISFLETSSVLEVYYEFNMEMLSMPNMPFGGKKMNKKINKVMGKMMDSQSGFFQQSTGNFLLPLIKTSIKETIKKTEDDRYSGLQLQPSTHIDSSVQDPLKLLKLKYVEGEITEEEYLRKKKILED